MLEWAFKTLQAAPNGPLDSQSKCKAQLVAKWASTWPCCTTIWALWPILPPFCPPPRLQLVVILITIWGIARQKPFFIVWGWQTGPFIEHGKANSALFGA